MKILEDIYVVGGGNSGIGISAPLDCNIYLIDGGTDSVLIDAGVGVNTKKIFDNILLESIDKKKISKLILTHAHLDHSGGAAQIKKFINPKIYASEIEAPYIESGDEDAIGLTMAKKSKVYPKSYKMFPEKIDNTLKGGEEIVVGKYTLRIISTPGHSKGSVCILLEGHKKKVLFTGDTVFMNGLICLFNLPDSSLADYRVSIKKLSKLSIDCLIPSHHGFTLSNGQSHINMAINALENLWVPRMV